jgi:hypothetical protein
MTAPFAPRPARGPLWLLPLTLLTLCASSASAAAGGGGPPNFNPCVLPQNYKTPENCASNSWLGQCGSYYGIAADPMQDPYCGPLLTARLKKYAQKQGGALDEKVFSKTDDVFVPAIGADPWLPAKRTGTQVTWANQEDKAKFDATQAWIWDPTTYHRANASYPQQTIYTCEGYVYRSFYDLEQWIDATNACKGDPRCIVSVSMHGMGAKTAAKLPGIARRKLMNADNQPIFGDRMVQLVKEDKLAQIEADPFNDDLYQLDEVPKNQFYANTKWFMVPKLVQAFQPTGQDQIVGALLDELSRGEQLYVAGQGSPTVSGVYYQDEKGNPHQGFFDEWDFHRVMNNRSKNTTDGEMKEYRQRQKEFTAQYDKLVDEWKCLYADAMIAGGCKGLNIPNAVGKVNPGDTQIWEGDPFASRSIYGKLDSSQLIVPPFITGNVGVGADLTPTAFGPLANLSDAQIGAIGSLITQGTKAIPMKAHHAGLLTNRGRAIGTVISWNNGQVANLRGQNAWLGNYVPHVDPGSLLPFRKITASFLVARTWEVNPPRPDLTSPTPRLDCTLPDVRPRPTAAVNGVSVDAISNPLGGLVLDDIFHTQRIWKDVCILTNMLLDEWARTQKGHPSCIDRANSTCDWMPQDFVDRFYTRNVSWASAAKETEYKYCKRWTGGGKLYSPLNGPFQIGVPNSNNFDLAGVRSYLAAREVNFNKLFQQVPVKQHDDFGTVRADQQSIGGKQFGGGFSYSLGWHANVKKRMPKDDPDYGDQICRLGGNAAATLSAEAILFGHHSSIIDGLAMVSSNEDDDGKAYGNAHLYVVGYELFDTKDAPAEFKPQPDGKIDISATYSDGKFNGDKITLFAVPFQAGPITITITVGIDYSYGFIAGFKAGGPPTDKKDPNYCNPQAKLYSASAMFEPQASLGAWLDADASFLGFGVGLEVELTLVGIGLPLTAEVSLGLDKDQNLAILFDARLDLDLVTLKGSMGVYVKALFIKIFSITLVSWDGFHHKFPIFRTKDIGLPLGPLLSNIIEPAGSDKQHPNAGNGSENL